jgi:membrane-associated phospholipid phosphatase
MRTITEVLVLASFSLTWSLSINEFVLKLIFGRETPDEFLRTGLDAFHPLEGAPWSSFPSGHAVQIVSVVSVFMMTYPKQRPVWIGLMGAGLVALILGNWHFVSDVIAGAAFGGLGGAATVTLWRQRRRN